MVTIPFDRKGFNVNNDFTINLTINCLTELERVILEEISNNCKVVRDGL